jgi:hypothetical protein
MPVRTLLLTVMMTKPSSQTFNPYTNILFSKKLTLTNHELQQPSYHLMES